MKTFKIKYKDKDDDLFYKFYGKEIPVSILVEIVIRSVIMLGIKKEEFIDKINTSYDAIKNDIEK